MTDYGYTKRRLSKAKETGRLIASAVSVGRNDLLEQCSNELTR